MNEEDSLVALPELTNDDISHICRVCLQDGVLKSVFADDEVPKLSHKINECASVEVQKGDGLPENICDYCISELNLAYYFRNQCRISDAKLRRVFHQPNGKEIEETITGDINVTNNNENEVSKNENQTPILTDAIPPKSEPVIEPPPPPPEIFPTNTPRIESLFENQACSSLQPPISLTSITGTNLPPLLPINHPFRQVNGTQAECLTTDIPSTNGNDTTNVIRKYLNNENGKKYVCPICGKNFIFLSRLRQHQIIHTGDRPYKCNKCNKAFYRKDTLNAHVTTHDNQKPYKCDKCVAHFTRRNSLKKHYYIHTDIKQFKCMICSKIFGRRDNYNIHMKSHSGLKKFQCEFCPKAFVRSDVLMRHKKTHEVNTRKYICAICLKTYSRSDVLRTHLKQHVKNLEKVE